MSTEPLNTFAYVLTADNVTIAYPRQATFRTVNSLEFEAFLLMDQRFLDGVSNRGYLPFHRWSLTTLNTALQETGRVVWNQSRVARFRFPALNNQSPTPLRSLVQLAVARVRDADPGGSAGTSGAARGPHLQIAGYLFDVKVDGLEGAPWSVSRTDAFDIGDGLSEDLVLTISREANADPYRAWLRDGNTSRSGSLILLDNGLRKFFTVRFTGLRVRNVTPAISTHSSNPATVSLMYSDIRFGVDK